jgi:hypothetical protein
MDLPANPLMIYVAASSKEMPRVDAALALIDAAGPKVVVCTFRWIDEMRATMAAGIKESDLNRDEARAIGRKCLKGVWDADVVWLLYPTTPTRGAWGEIAASVTMRELSGWPRQLSVVSYENPADFRDPGAGAQIFARMADAEIAGDENAFKWILENVLGLVEAQK